MPGNVAPSDVVPYRYARKRGTFCFFLDAVVYIRMYMYIQTCGRHPGECTHTRMGVRAVSSVIRAM